VNRRPTLRHARVAGRAGPAVALALVWAVAAGADAGPRPGTAADCRDLARQFDVAWPAHKDMARAAGARHARELGATACEAGRYTEGVRYLRRALHDIGVKPVKIVGTPPRS